MPSAPWELAQVNVAVMRAPLDDPLMRGFVLAFDTVARAADENPGLRWRGSGSGGHPIVTDPEGTTQIVNISVWSDYPSMHRFVYHSLHGRVLLRRAGWFAQTPQPSTALWWVAAGAHPTLEEGLARLRYLRTHGPSPQSFSLTRQFDAAGVRLRRR